MTVRVLVAGAGRAGLVHARNLAAGVPGATLAGIADPSREARVAAVRELGEVPTFVDPEAAVADGDFDAVVIAAPTFAHADIAVSALGAGRHVLCEKPLASTLDEAARVVEAATASDGAFLMAFMRRFDAGFARVAERIAAGDIGEPVLVKSTGRGPGLPPEWAWDVRRSGGLAAEVNSHDFDTVRWLSGQEIERLYALGRAAKRPDIAARYPGFVDVVSVNLELDGGALAHVDGACPADYGYDARVEVYGTEGVLFAGDPAARHGLLIRADGVVSDPFRSWREVFAAAYRAEDAHFVSVAAGEEAPRTSVTDGVRALEAVVAANRSMASGEPVRIKEVGS